jgi:fructose/tagatose bisphosphate aldolase
MPLITNKNAVLDLYKEAAEKKWVIPCFCTENLTCTEGILAAVKEYGDAVGIKNLPIIVSLTNQYAHRHQSVNYTHTRNWKVGLKLFLNDLKVLTGSDSPFKDLRVMVHLDHIQHDIDKELFTWDLKEYSSIMYDASTLPFDKNIKATADFVKKFGKDIVIEGACDEIKDASHGVVDNTLTTPENAEKYFKETGVDFFVANLGTEHRASSSELHYYGDIAKKIKSITGTKMVLHGASSVPSAQLGTLFNDGICKVNIWAMLERDSVPLLFSEMVKNGSRISGKAVASSLKKAGFLGEKAIVDSDPSLEVYATIYRQDIIFNEIKRIITGFLKMWYI